MEHLPRQQYTTEFREQAVRLVLEQQVTIPEAARRLAMSGRTLERGRASVRRWEKTDGP
jgi:transposase-like protein